ncbi:Aste57867_8765 [Aphanomyces stellatus]|uniref:Aste57867_8765 protein n=1 Tax=Aphanomyces stellatus TaxID=120398 RepID=A0A485KLB0_9STRA|nr:hypothetical protein As57867_008731 [Aphanomyces stellatus]VFT85651.1 Aste57867_8765 [Aphanomyces stellatus]
MSSHTAPSELQIDTSVANYLPSPTSREHCDARRPPVIFPGSPIWTNADSHDIHSRGRSRHHDDDDSGDPRHMTKGRRQHDRDTSLAREYEYLLLFAVVALLWIAAVWFALHLVRFPFHVYWIQSTVILVAPLVPFYWLTRFLFRCVGHFRDDNHHDVE